MKRVQKNKYLSFIYYADFCFIWLIFSGCMNLMSYYDMDTNLIESSYKAADHLVSCLPPLSYQNHTIVPASFVNINNLEESSCLGKSVSEYIASRLSQHGFKVTEIKLSKSVSEKLSFSDTLSFFSREIKEINSEYHAEMVLTGTYSIADDVVYISARMLNPVDATLLASYEYKLPLGNNNLKMLAIPDIKKKKRFPPGPLENFNR